MKNHAGGDCSMISGMACGSYFVDKVRFRYRFQGKAGRIHIFTVPDCRGIRHQGRETPDKRIYQTGQNTLCQIRYSISGWILLT